METGGRAVIWETFPHVHFEKGGDWYWILGILALALAIAAFFFGNFLLALLILVGAFTIALVAAKQPEVIECAVTARGVRIGSDIHTYASLAAYAIDDTHYAGPHLLLRSKKLYSPVIVVPIPEEYVDEIEDILIERLAEEDLEEPLVHRLMDIFGV